MKEAISVSWTGKVVPGKGLRKSLAALDLARHAIRSKKRWDIPWDIPAKAAKTQIHKFFARLNHGKQATSNKSA
jgi:hypothetical protein